jgi:hypothetical protein
VTADQSIYYREKAEQQDPRVAPLAHVQHLPDHSGRVGCGGIHHGFGS